MNPLDNPFVPGAGTPPPELAGRDQLMESARIALGRTKLGRFAKSMVLVGLRGVGKTVLLVRIRNQAEAQGFRSILVEAREGKGLPALLAHPLRQILFSLDSVASVSHKTRRGLRVLASFIKSFRAKVGEVELSIDPEVGAADSGDLENDLGNLLVAVAEAATEQGTAIALCLDEMQYLSEEELSALILSIHQVSQRQLPLVLMGAALPQVIGLAGRSKSYAERLFDFPELGPLDEPAARAALQDPARSQGVSFAEDGLAEIYRETQGYPYFLQQWGYEAWNLATESPITLGTVQQASQKAVKRLDEGFFRVRFDRLTPREKVYLRALAELGPGSQRSSEIAEAMGVKVNTIAPLRAGLIRKGMIFSPTYGETAFTVPLFDQFMKRMILDYPRGSGS